MDFRFNTEENAYRAEVLQFITDEMTDDIALAGVQGEAADPRLADRVRQLRMKVGSRGWISMSWPKNTEVKTSH